MRRAATTVSGSDEHQEMRRRTRQRLAAGPVLPVSQQQASPGAAGAASRRSSSSRSAEATPAGGRPLSATERHRLADLARRLDALRSAHRLADCRDATLHVVRESQVDELAWRHAHMAAATASAELAVDVPFLAWFDGNGTGCPRGYAPAADPTIDSRDDFVMIKASLRGVELVNTVAHECAHVAGYGHPDADRFAADFARRHAAALCGQGAR